MILHTAENGSQLLKIPDKEYFALPRLNSGSIAKLNQSIDSFIAYKKQASSPTDAMKVGSAFHSLMEGTFDEKYVITEIDGRTKEGKALKAKYAEEGKQVVSPADGEMLKIWQFNASKIPFLSSNLLDISAQPDNINEAVVLYEHQDVECKAMCDLFLPSSNIILDWKTTQRCDSEQKLHSSVFEFGYYIQAQFYLNSMRALYGEDMNFEIYYVFFEKTPPYGVRLYVFDKSYLEFAQKQIDMGIFLYKDYLKNKQRYESKEIYGGYSTAPVVGRLPYWIANKREEQEEF